MKKFKNSRLSTDSRKLQTLALNTRRCVNKVSRHFSLLLFWSLSFEFYLLIFFDNLPVWECLSALSQLNVRSSVSTYSQGVFFAGNCTCNLTFWPELLSFAICDCISVWYFTLQHDCPHKSFDLSIRVKLQKTLETSKSFENNKIIVSCNTICFWHKHRTIFPHGTCSHVLLQNKHAVIYNVSSCLYTSMDCLFAFRAGIWNRYWGNEAWHRCP